HVIDLHGNLRSRIISRLLPGSNILRYDKQALKRRLLLSGIKANTRHTVDAYLAALNPLVECGTRNAECGFPKIYISKEDQDRVGLFLSETGIPGSETIIGISPGAKWPTKRWMEDGFVEVGRRSVKELGAKVIVFGGPDEIELCKRVAAGIGKEALSVAGKVGLKETSALTNRCKVFVSNDSGPMHIATAVGTPVVAIFGPTVQGFGFSPLGKSVVVEKELECRPCSLHGSSACPKGHFKCMRQITAQEVFERVEEMMG
ncbi:MAG: glycosyltransferase family 9 protein, partial [Deltaproteobacteria bacterium]